MPMKQKKVQSLNLLSSRVFPQKIDLTCFGFRLMYFAFKNRTSQHLMM